MGREGGREGERLQTNFVAKSHDLPSLPPSLPSSQAKERELRSKRSSLYQLAVLEAKNNIAGLEKKHAALSEKLLHERVRPPSFPPPLPPSLPPPGSTRVSHPSLPPPSFPSRPS